MEEMRRKGGPCDHPRCEGDPEGCRMWRSEDVDPTPEDLEFAKKLIEEGWVSTSTKYRRIARYVTQVNGIDLIAPEYRDTWMGKELAQRWDSGKNHWLRMDLEGRREGIEHKEITFRQFRAFKKLNGPMA